MCALRKPSYRRRRLGRRLRAMREATGMTIEQAAKKLDKARTSLVRIEIGEYQADVHLIRSMMDLYDQFEADLLDEAREALKPPWFKKFGLQDMGYVDVETEASRVSEFACQVVPGLLQTPDYIRALMETRQRTPSQVQSEVKVREIRKDRLAVEDDSLELLAIVDEGALRREIGSPELMKAQLGHLIVMAELPMVSLQVLPFRSGVHSALDGAFILLDFPDPAEQPVLYHSYVSGALHIENKEEVRAAKLAFDALRSEALSSDDSVALIESLHRQS